MKQPSMEANRRHGKDQEEEPNVAAVQVSKPAPHLPQEILRDILLRLPARSLQQLKDVCPSWRAIISDTRFIKSHLNQANKKGGIVSYCEISNLDEYPQPIYLTYINRKAWETETVKLRYPFNDQANLVEVMGSCNGLQLIGISYTTLLWNPATGEYFTLAGNCWESESYGDDEEGAGEGYGDDEEGEGEGYGDDEEGEGEGYDSDGEEVRYIYGLGYDSSREEYKAILLSVKYELFAGPHMGEVQSDMFITKNGTWKRVDDGAHEFPYGTSTSSCSGITVNGSPHWVVSDSVFSNYGTIIIYFDMADEKFKRLPTPSSWSSKNLDIAVLEGCLIGITRYDRSGHVWAMKEYGVRESWTKLFTIPMHSDRTWSMVPLGFTKNGDEVVLYLNGSKLVTYNLNTHVEDKIIEWTTGKFGAVYVDTLVSPGFNLNTGEDN